jgi:phage RecT family recombinase
MEQQIDIATIDGLKAKARELMAQNGFSPEKIMRELSFAMQHFAKNEYLDGATPSSKLRAIVNISQVGLTLNPVAKEAYLVPRYSKDNGLECILDPSYVGLVKLLTDAGSVQSIITNVVYENDKFELNLADTVTPVKHQPELINSKRGNIIGCYSLATLLNGSKQVEWMDIEQINEIRERSEGYKSWKSGKAKSCIWDSDYSEMCRKTVIKRIYKYLPRTQKMELVDKAIDLSNHDYEITEEQRNYIEALMEAARWDDDRVKFMRIDMNSMGADKAGKVIAVLKEEVDSVKGNPNFDLRSNQSQTLKHLNKLD